MPSGISDNGRAELAQLTAPGRELVTVQDAATILGIPQQAAAQKLARLAAGGWLRNVRRNLYIPVPANAPDPSRWSADPLFLADAVWDPCYFTGWTSANYWGLTEQVFRSTVVMTSTRVRDANQNLAGNDYVVLHVADDRLAHDMHVEWRQGRRIKIANAARTVAEIFDNPRIGGGIRLAAEILTAYLDDADDLKIDELLDASDRLNNRTIFKRLGYVTNIVRPNLTRLIDDCATRLSRGVSLLDPRAPNQGPTVGAWQIRANVTIDMIDPS
jgi:predicted transcriptional regulator of viral defense system